jgi:TPR repeat protein
MPEVTDHSEEKDPLAPLWNKSYEAAEKGDMAGVLYVWKSLAEQGVWQLHARIAEVYERGANGVDANIEQALQWYRRAVYEGDDPVAHLGLGRAYYTGIGVDRDFSEALKHFKKASSHGLPDAAVYLGLMYFRGHGVDRDITQAEVYFQLGADASYFIALYMLARIACGKGKFITAARLFLKGWFLARRILDNGPDDPRLLGIKWSSSKKTKINGVLPFA